MQQNEKNAAGGEVILYMYHEGESDPPKSVAADHELADEFNDWLDTARQAEGWHDSILTYAPSIVISNERAKVNFTGNLVVLQLKTDDEAWPQIVRKRRPADEALLNMLREQLVSEEAGQGGAKRPTK